MSFKKYNDGTWQPINPKQLKGVPYTGTLPATLTGTKAGYLHRYKIYGNLEQTGTPTPSDPIYPSECGERTANLFNVSDYSVGTTSFVTKRITLEPNTTYTMSSNCPLYNVGALIVIGNVGESFTTAKNGVYPNHPISRTTDANGELVIGLRTNGSDYAPADYDTMLNLGSTPLPYIPYGYKLPLTSAGQDVDIFIGDDTLSTDEYVDYGTQKIYKDVDIWNPNGTTINNQGETQPGNTLVGNIKYSLKNNSAYTFYYRIGASSTSSTAISAGTELSITPSDTLYIWSPVSAGMSNFMAFTKQFVDPPVPFPQIPTSAGSTTISWAGSGLAPSQFDSIQEWVDISTYKRVNGEWVADNSN